ncbi:MAG: hypothetical protein HYX67_09155 [Candidatus Melainabacteria bacterium]|nr:hypothetical protein [Candidatus Melainabacteria bacterium]
MQDFDTTTEDDATTNENEEGRESHREKFRVLAKGALKKFVLFLSFGPGVLGFLWLLGRILKR